MCRTTSNITQFRHTLRDDELQILVAERKSVLQFSSGMRHMKCAKFAWTKRVRFRDAIVTDVFERPATLSADISSLYYTQNDYKRFRYEFTAVKKAIRMKKLKLSGLPYQHNAVRHIRELGNEKSLFDNAISYFFGQQQSPSTSCADTRKFSSISNDTVPTSWLIPGNNWITTSSDMQHVWDLDLVSSVF